MYNVQKVHITTMCPIDVVTGAENSRLCFGISSDRSNNEFLFANVKKRCVSGKPCVSHSNHEFYLIVFDKKRKSHGKYKGQAFQNGKIVEEYMSTINGVCQHHYFIEYIGKFFDNINARPCYE